jgi:uncharacterized protein YjbI with pentapeptide repeats
VADLGEQAEEKSERLANFSVAAAVLLFAYVAIAVLKQSDAELILPSSRFDLGGMLEKFKEGIPGGAFVTPLLQIEIPLSLFYTLAPVGLLILHAAAVLQPGRLRSVAAPLRIMAIWMPPFVLGLIRWRFSPYVASEPPPPSPATIAIEAVQLTALALDIGVIAIALLWNRAEESEKMIPLSRRVALALRASWQTGPLWLAALLAWPIGIELAGGSRERSSAETLMIAAGLAVAALWILRGAARWRTSGLSWLFVRSSRDKEDLDMSDRLLLAAAFLGLGLLPASGRAIDVSGESLVAQAPSETMMAALVVSERASGSRLRQVRRDAWSEYGRGIDLSGWRFPGGRFDHATMAHIDLTGADLRSAFFDFANLIGADLSRAKLRGASLRYADLSLANPRGTNTIRRAELAESKPNGDAVVAQTTTAPSDEVLDLKDADLTGAILEGADLANANLTNATLKGAFLKRAKLGNAILKGANFCAADLRGVDLSNAQISADTEFSGTDLAGATLPRNFEAGRLNGANLFGAKIQPAKEGASGEHPNWKALKGKNIRRENTLIGKQEVTNEPAALPKPGECPAK